MVETQQPRRAGGCVLLPVIDGLHIVAVRIEHEGPVMPIRVLRPQLRDPVIWSCGVRGGRIEDIDLFLTVGGKSDVRSRTDGILERDREVIRTLHAKSRLTDTFAPPPELLAAKRLKGGR